MITVTATSRGFNIKGKIDKLRAGLIRANAVYLQAQTERINQGIDTRGAAFKPYSPKYGALKAAAGRTGNGEWLRLTGGMLRHQKYTIEMVGKIAKLTIAFSGVYSSGHFATNKRGKVVIRRGEQVQASFIASVNNRTRKFVGTRTQDLHAIKRVIFGR